MTRHQDSSAGATLLAATADGVTDELGDGISLLFVDDGAVSGGRNAASGRRAIIARSRSGRVATARGSIRRLLR